MDKRNTEKLNETLIEAIRVDYTKTQSARQTAKNLNVGKTTVLSYVTPNKSVRISDEERRKRAVQSVIRRRKKLKQMAVEYKGGKCVQCSYNKCLRAMEFHHLDPNEKDFGISANGYTLSWEKIKKELDKCILVCSNCHAEIHDELENKLDR